METIEILTVLKAAHADLIGIMPEFEPSGDRNHPAWQTIEELEAAICELTPTNTPPDGENEDMQKYVVKLLPGHSALDHQNANGYLAFNNVVQEYELKYARRKAKMYNGKIERAQK